MDRDGLTVLSTDPLNAETSWEALQEPVTPTPAFFKRNHFAVPDVDAHGWRLHVVGGSTGPVDLTIEDLRGLSAETREVTLECAGNGRAWFDPSPGGTPWSTRAVSTARWTGTPLRGVLEQVGMPAEAIEVGFEGADGGDHDHGPYARSLPLEVARSARPLLVWGMNGQPLPREHGGPVRLLVSGWYGMASVKWLRRIWFLDEPFDGFFQADDYVVRTRSDADRPVTRMRPRSLIVQPLDGAVVASPVNLTGWAWSGSGPVVRVEVDAGDAEARAATLGPVRGEHAWRRWELRVPLAPGEHAISARATDAAGDTQPDEVAWNDGGYENNAPQRITLLVE